MPKARSAGKRIFYIAIAGLALAYLYWLKNVAGINLLKDFSLSAYFPFNLLKPEFIMYPEPGQLILAEDFEPGSPNPVEWMDVYTTDPAGVTVSYEPTGVNASTCLVVKNPIEQRWHITHRYQIAATPQGKFSMEAMLWRSGTGGSAELQVGTIDDKGRVINRNIWHVGSSTQGSFERVGTVFSVSPDAAFIRFRLAGEGPGEFRFDNIKFRRLEDDS